MKTGRLWMFLALVLLAILHAALLDDYVRASFLILLGFFVYPEYFRDLGIEPPGARDE